MVAADIANTWSTVAGSVPVRCPWADRFASRPGSAGRSRFPVGPSSTAQHRSNKATASSS
jgi:hypothetical protein